MSSISYPHITKEKNLPVYVTGVGSHYFQPTLIKHTASSHELFFSVGGSGEITVDGKTYIVEEKSGFFIGKGVEYSCATSKEEKEWTVDWLSFEITSKELENELLTRNKIAKIAIQNPEKITAGVNSICNSVNGDYLYGGFEASSQLYSILIELNKCCADVAVQKKKSAILVDQIVKYIEEHYTEDITLSQLCDIAGGISEQYLCRLFKEYTGERPIEYMLRKRIAVSKSYLEMTDIPINEIAVLTGFNNSSYFYRNFKKFIGMSPLVCRQNALK